MKLLRDISKQRFLYLLVVLRAVCVRSTEDVKVIQFDIQSSVSMRFSDVHIRSVIENGHEEAEEVTFMVRVPKTAFIHRFWLTTENKTTRAEVKEKGKAEEIYSDAKEAELVAGKVTQPSDVRDDYDRNIFSIRVNVAAKRTVEFHLQYQELLERVNGKYQQSLYVDSPESIPSLSITSEIKEREIFRSIYYQTPLDDQQYTDLVESVSPDGLYVRKMYWSPTLEEQENFADVLKPFLITYELEPTGDGGYVYTNVEGEFAHLFASQCDEAKILMKKVVFVIDISGSMKGTPIRQVAVAMERILGQLRSNDYFTIILFSKGIQQWWRSFQPVSDSTIRLAREFLKDNLNAGGSTNINDALLEATNSFASSEENDDIYGNIILFLTDGEATEGITDRKQILENVRMANSFDGEKCCKASITSIAFGSKTDIAFLQRLADENAGKLHVIRVSDDEEAGYSLIESFESVENPVYKNLKFQFNTANGVIPEENITQSEFVQYDCGSEIIVGGWSHPNVAITPRVFGTGVERQFSFDSIPVYSVTSVNARSLSKLVQYQRVQFLLKQHAESKNELEQDAIAQTIIELAIKNEFVTPMTSLVVVDYTKPKRESVVFSSASNRAAGSPGNNLNAGSGLDDLNLDDFLIDINGENPLESSGQGWAVEGTRLAFILPVCFFQIFYFLAGTGW